MSDNNQKPDAWGQNKNIPDSWGKNNKLPENWGKQSSNADNGTPSGGTKMASSSSVENTANLSDKAKSGIGLLAGAAKKVGGAAKNAAGNAVEYAKSDDVKDKLIAAKNKAKFIANGAGSSLADMERKIMDENNNYLNDVENTEIVDAPIFESTDNNDIVPATEETKESNIDSANVEATADYEPVQIPESSQAPITELPENNEYTNNIVSEKKSKLVPVLIGVIAVLLVEVGVLGGVLLSKNKDSSSNDKTNENNQQTTETSTEESSEPTVKSSNIEKAANTVLIEMYEEGNNISGFYLICSDITKNANLPSNNFDIDCFYKDIKDYFKKVDAYEWFVAVNNGNVEIAAIGDSWDTKAFGSEDTLQVLYDKAIEKAEKYADNKGIQQQDQYTADEVSDMYSKFISDNPDPNHTYDDPKYGYYLIDLNEDGKQELLITTEEVEAGSPGVVAAYAINNKNLTQLWITDSRFIGYLCEGNIINSFTAMGQGGGTALYKYNSGNQLDLIDMVSFDYSSGSKVMYHNQEIVSEADADAILAQYKKMKFEAKPLKISSVSEPQTEPTTLASPKETYIFFGVVSTESGALNLRDKPSADSNVIAQLEKGTKGDVFSIEGISDWYKFITSDGKEGYVSAQYIKEYDHSSGNSSSNIIGTQTPWGIFTYTDNYNIDGQIYNPESIGVYINCDFDRLNEYKKDYRIDNIAFYTYKSSSISDNSIHDYKIKIIVMGTVLKDIRQGDFSPSVILTNDNGYHSSDFISSRPSNMNAGETFCLSTWGTITICDNTTYDVNIN